MACYLTNYTATIYLFSKFARYCCAWEGYMLFSFGLSNNKGVVQHQEVSLSSVENEALIEMPLMGLGTFIGLEADHIANRKERKRITSDSIFNALSIGYRHLDLAQNYSNLDAVSDALKKAFKPKDEGGLGLKREDIWLTMKSDGPFTQMHISSLLELVGVEYFDLFLIHHSSSEIFDSEKNLERNWRDLANIDGKSLRRIGVSNFYEPHLSRLLAICDRDSLVKPYANEIELNLISKNISLMDYCHRHEIRLIAYSPLAYNLSTLLLDNSNLENLAAKIHAKPAQAALAWIMAKGIAVIPKSTQEIHLKENYYSQNYIEAVKGHHLSAAIDAEPDFIEGVTGTAVDSKQHGKSLSWEVSIEGKPIKKMRNKCTNILEYSEENGNEKLKRKYSELAKIPNMENSDIPSLKEESSCEAKKARLGK